MDPFTGEGELLNVHNAFHQGQYSEVTSFDAKKLSASNALPYEILSYRAQLAEGEVAKVLKGVEGKTQPEFLAVKSLALYMSDKHAESLKLAEKLASENKDNRTVQVLVATVLQAEGKSEEALALLGAHQGSLEAVALIVQIHLQQNRTDLALKEVQAARRWAQDSLLVNIAESWVGLRMGGERYQQAFYVFEEMAQAPPAATKGLVGQAVSELHLGRIAEAEAALQEAIKIDPHDAEVIANTIVLTVLMGKDATDQVKSLRAVSPSHLLLKDMREKSDLFDRAAGKYSAKVAG